jgi:general secretion pathway protein H
MSAKDKGFTLLEIIIVLFLITLVAGLSSVLFTNALPSEQFKSTARQIAASMKQTRAAALSSGESRAFIINLNEKTYQIEGKNPKTIPYAIDIQFTDSFRGAIKQGTAEIVFYPSGGIESGSILLSYGNKQITIQPDPVVGSIQIKN